MAKRSVYISDYRAPYMRPAEVEFTFFSGFSLAQKQRCIRSLHESFLASEPDIRILEISTKSTEPLGVALSAFNLTIETPRRSFTVESAFQSSKVFEMGGPYTDLLGADARTAKRDERLRSSGRVIGFRFHGRDYPTEPKDLFYNWIYINALVRQRRLAEEVCAYGAFSDIEFNPAKSLNCQAVAAAIYVGLRMAGKLDEALANIGTFESLVYGSRPTQADEDEDEGIQLKMPLL